MSKKVKCIFIVMCFVCDVSIAATTAGTSSMTFLKISQGARPAGMGEMYSAVADDSLALFWNPAGLSFISNPELSTQYFSYIEDTSMQNLIAAIPLMTQKIMTLAGGLTYVNSSAFTKTVVANNTYGFEERGSFSATDIRGTVGLGVEINPQVNWGMSASYMQEKIDDESAGAFGVDIGFIFKSIDRPYRLAFVVQNMGSDVTFKKESFDIPQLFKFSVARDMNQRGWIGFEGIKSNDSDIELRFGAEAAIVEYFIFRCGYKLPSSKSNMGDFTGVTGGIGFRFPYILFDYAAVFYGDFGLTHRISMNFKFGQE